MAKHTDVKSITSVCFAIHIRMFFTKKTAIQIGRQFFIIYREYRLEFTYDDSATVLVVLCVRLNLITE